MKLTTIPGNFLAFLLFAAVHTACTGALPTAPTEVQSGYPGDTSNETDLMFLGLEEAQGIAQSQKVRLHFSIVEGSMYPIRRLGGNANSEDIRKALSSNTSTYMILELNSTQPGTLNNTVYKIVFINNTEYRNETNANTTGLIMMGKELGPVDVASRLAKTFASFIFNSTVSMKVFRPIQLGFILRFLASTSGGNQTYIVININGTRPYMLNNSTIRISYPHTDGVGQESGGEVASKLHML